MRSWSKSKSRLKPLLDYFGEMRLRNITYKDLEEFKRKRLAEKTHRGKPVLSEEEEGKQRSVADVHRSLELMRRILNVAKREGWIDENPFGRGDALIIKSHEQPRQRILSREEESKLLAQCVGRRKHLKAIIICALDTGLRRGELFKLTWQDVDLETGFVYVRELNSKTGKSRLVGLTDRAKSELSGLRSAARGESVFNITDVKRAFTSACKDAGITGFRFHDLRHTFCTRLVEAGVPMAKAMRLSGHSQTSTFLRYTNTDEDTIRSAAAALNALLEKG